MTTFKYFLVGVALVFLEGGLAQLNPGRTDNYCPSGVDSDKTPKLIPGTGLKTYTFYKLGLKRFPQGVVTWTQEGKSTFNYVQIDNNPEHRDKYGRGKEWQNDAMWEFVPARGHCGKPVNWYGLRSRGKPGAYFTWGKGERMREWEEAFFMVLESNYPGDRKKEEYLLKPVKVTKDGKSYYQFRLGVMPEGVVTWSWRQYGDRGSHFIEVDNRVEKDKRYEGRYREGGDWWEDTLFTVDEPEQGSKQEEEKMDELELEK